MLTIKEDVYLSEIYAYLMLRDNLLKNSQVVIGDDIPNGLPDIYSTDKKIGVEVTCVEEPHVYNLVNALHKKSVLKQGDFDTINMKFVNTRLKNANIKSKIKLSTNATLNAKSMLTREKTFQALERVLNKKLERISNRTSYSGCENVYLFLVSDYITKKHVTVNDYRNIYLNLCKNYTKKFDGVFVALNDKLYFIDKQNKINIVKHPNQVKQIRQDTKYKHLEQKLEREM